MTRVSIYHCHSMILVYHVHSQNGTSITVLQHALLLQPRLCVACPSALYGQFDSGFPGGDLPMHAVATAWCCGERH